MLISKSQILATLRECLNPTSLNRSLWPTAPAINNVAPSSSKVKSYPIQLLDALVTRHFRATQSAPLTLSGRYLPLIYLLVATLLAAPHNKAIVIIDLEASFDITRVLQTAPYRSVSVAERTTSSPGSPASDAPLQQDKPSSGNPADRPAATHHQRLTVEDLKHVYIYRPTRGSPSHIRDVLTSAEHHMIYASHASISREWWGTIIIGGGSPTTLGAGNGDVMTGWKGWLRINRDNVRGFSAGMSIEEALADRDQRQRAVEEAGYTATSAWGGFAFGNVNCE